MGNWREYLISVESTVAMAVAMIEHTKEKMVIVVDSTGVLRGIVTKADINAWLLRNSEMEVSIEKVMNSRPKSFPFKKTDDEILDYMLKSNIRQLPLVDDNGVVCDIKCIDENDITWVTRTDNIKSAVLENSNWGDTEYRRIVFLGDGLTDFCEWAELINIPGVVLCNRGIFGNTISDVRNRLDFVLQLRPVKIFLMVGINDFIRGRYIDCIFEDYLALVMEIKKKAELCGAEIYLQSILPVQNCGLTDLDSKKIWEFNKRIHILAKQNNIVYIDVCAALVKEYEIPAKYTVDGWHLNETGYKVWLSCIEEYLF